MRLPEKRMDKQGFQSFLGRKLNSFFNKIYEKKTTQ